MLSGSCGYRILAQRRTHTARVAERFSKMESTSRRAATCGYTSVGSGSGSKSENLGSSGSLKSNPEKPALGATFSEAGAATLTFVFVFVFVFFFVLMV